MDEGKPSSIFTSNIQQNTMNYYINSPQFSEKMLLL